MAKRRAAADLQAEAEAVSLELREAAQELTALRLLVTLLLRRLPARMARFTREELAACIAERGQMLERFQDLGTGEMVARIARPDEEPAAGPDVAPSPIAHP